LTFRHIHIYSQHFPPHRSPCLSVFIRHSPPPPMLFFSHDPCPPDPSLFPASVLHDIFVRLVNSGLPFSRPPPPFFAVGLVHQQQNFPRPSPPPPLFWDLTLISGRTYRIFPPCCSSCRSLFPDFFLFFPPLLVFATLARATALFPSPWTPPSARQVPPPFCFYSKSFIVRSSVSFPTS